MRSVVPRGDGTPGDDYPTRVQRAVFGYVRGQLLFSLIMGTSAGVALWVDGLARHLPRGQDVRAGVRRLLRLRRADPVRRPGDRRGAAGADRAVQRQPARRAVARRSCSRRCSRSRATSSRRPSSRRRCGSTRCWSSSRCSWAAGCTASRAPSWRCRSPRWCARPSSTSASTWCSSRGALRPPPSSATARRPPPARGPGRGVPRVRHARRAEAAYCGACGTELADADEAAAAASAAPS